MSASVAVVATAHAKPHLSEELGAAFLEIVGPTRQEAGCEHYTVHRSRENPDTWMVYEVWASQEAFDAHLQEPHLKRLLARLPELVVGELGIQTFARSPEGGLAVGG